MSILDFNYDSTYIDKFILRSFTYYKNHREEEVFKNFPNQLISIYYDLNYNDIRFDNMKKSFVEKYVKNESKLEGVNSLTKHGKEEIEGFEKMYEYMHSDEINDDFDIFTLNSLNKELFSCAPYPEFGGRLRRDFAHLSGVKTDLCPWEYIYPSLKELDETVVRLRAMSPLIKEFRDSRAILSYLDECVELNCKLVKIHPFSDGNGRTIRCFTNKLMEDAGLPSVYVKSSERDEYLSAMNKALDLEDYEDIKKFYRYKVCDSIVELDINDRISSSNKDNNSGNINSSQKINKLK